MASLVMTEGTCHVSDKLHQLLMDQQDYHNQ